ncbi:MAG TPA: hypothetical protein VIZ18_10675 [Ktedonobacteraceae bacterium]
MKTLKAIYNFIVGDMIILVGILIIALLLALIANIGTLAPLRVAIGPILIVAALVTLSATLYREARGKR